MIWSAHMGLPLSLADVGAVLGLKEQKLKDNEPTEKDTTEHTFYNEVYSSAL